MKEPVKRVGLDPFHHAGKEKKEKREDRSCLASSVAVNLPALVTPRQTKLIPVLPGIGLDSLG